MRSRFLALFVLLSLLPFLTGATIVIRGPRIAVVGTPAWAYVNTGSTADFSGNEVFYIRTPIVADQTGSCTKLAVWIVYRNFGTNFKIALYDASRNLLTSETVNASSASDGAYFEITLGSAQSVTASTTYNIAIISASDNFRFGKDTTPDSESLIDYSETYAGFPPDPGPAGSSLSAGMRVGMYIVP